MTQPTDSTYLLGETRAEHERLIRQGHIFAPFTERLFRDAGIETGQRVLDVGSGVGAWLCWRRAWLGLQAK